MTAEKDSPIADPEGAARAHSDANSAADAPALRPSAAPTTASQPPRQAKLHPPKLQRLATPRPPAATPEAFATVATPAAQALGTTREGTPQEALARALDGAASTHGNGSSDGLGGAAGSVRSRARLVPERNVCRRFFPARAKASHGVARVVVEIAADGTTAASRVISEEPANQGFGTAACACAQKLHFMPATSAGGAPVRDETKLELAFHRN